MSNITMTNKIIHIHLSSWRYFAALALPPLVLIFNLLFSAGCVLLMGLFFLTHYYCWRLWLDERLFKLIENEHDLIEFDNGMAHFGVKRKGNTRSLVERWSGAKAIFLRQFFLYWRCGLFHRAWFFTRLWVNQAESETAQTLIAPEH